MSAIKQPPLRDYRRTQLGCLLLGLLLVLPSLHGGFFADDFVQIAQLEGWSANPAAPLDLYAFVPRDAAVVERLRHEGVLPYFAAPELKIAFLRPLSSALMWLDHSLFARWPLPYHAHSLLWYAALLAVSAALLRRALPPALATLALLLYCLDDGHALAAGWIAARNATVSCALVFAGLVAHIRWRTEDWRPGAVLAPLAAAAGLSAGEMALGALAYLVAWEVTHVRPHRARALAPTLVLVAVYLAIHRFTESGSRGGGGYLDPFDDPLSFAAALPERALLLLGNLLVATPIDALLFDEHLRVPLVALGGITGLGALLWLSRALGRMPRDEAVAVRWLGLGAAGALLVSTPALPGERVLLAASLGSAVVVAALLRDAWRCFQSRRARSVAAAGLFLLGAPNVALAAMALPGKSLVFANAFDTYRRVAREAEISAPVPARVVVLALPDLIAIHLPVVRIVEQGLGPHDIRRLVADRAHGELPMPDRLGYLGSTVLSLASAEHRLRRTGIDAFELITPAGTLLDGAWPRTLRAPSLSLARGTVIRLSYMTATVMEDKGGRPTRVEFRFDRQLEDPSLIFLAPSEGRLRRFQFPTLGEEVSIPRGQLLQ